MADWINLQKPSFLTVDVMLALNNNFNYLRDYFLSFNLPVPELKDVTVDYSISPLEIQQKFNDVEFNIQLLENVTKNRLYIKNNYFKKFDWPKSPMDIKKEVYRWIDWLNEVKKYTIQYENLKDINGEQITDINGEDLIVLKVIKRGNLNA